MKCISRYRDVSKIILLCLKPNNVPVTAYNSDRHQTDSHLRSRSVPMRCTRTAEYGIAAHWKYKESGGSHSENNQSEQEKMAWLRRILEWQHRHGR